MNVFRRKSIASIQAEATAASGLQRSLGVWSLTLLGIGAIFGAGAFILAGHVAADRAGPAVILAFVIAGIASLLTALCYAELASVVPLAGSAYTYGYATLGELVAWVIGWDLILEYSLGAAAVANAWSGYVVSVLRDIGITVPCAYSAAHGVVVGCADGTSATAVFNLPAAVIIAIATVLLVLGIKTATTANGIIVLLKVAVALLFVAGAAHAIQPANWHPFIPPAQPGPGGGFGWTGVMTGSSVIFLSYIGFDAVSTVAQEAKHPRRDLPIGIIVSLLLCAVLYILVAGVMTGVVRYSRLNVPDPFSVAAGAAGIGWMAWMIKLAAILGLSSVILVMLLAQSRVFYSMATDGLLPGFMRTIHPRFQTPYLASILIGAVVMCVAAILPGGDLADLVAMAVLLASITVAISVMVLRYREPNIRRAFRAPALYLVAPLSAASAVYLMTRLSWPVMVRLIVWLVIGLAVFAVYGARHSRLNRPIEGRRADYL